MIQIDKVTKLTAINSITGEKEFVISEMPELIQENDNIVIDDIEKGEIIHRFQTQKPFEIKLKDVYIDPITRAEIFIGSYFEWYEKLWIRFWSRIEYYKKTKIWIKGGWL